MTVAEARAAFEAQIQKALDADDPNPWTVSVRIQFALQDYERALLATEETTR